MDLLAVEDVELIVGVAPAAVEALVEQDRLAIRLREEVPVELDQRISDVSGW